MTLAQIPWLELAIGTVIAGSASPSRIRQPNRAYRWGLASLHSPKTLRLVDRKRGTTFSSGRKMRQPVELSSHGCAEKQVSPAGHDLVRPILSQAGFKLRPAGSFGWPGRVRSTGRVAQRQEAAPYAFNYSSACLPPGLCLAHQTLRTWTQIGSNFDSHCRSPGSEAPTCFGIRMAQLLVALRPGRRERRQHSRNSQPVSAFAR